MDNDKYVVESLFLIRRNFSLSRFQETCLWHCNEQHRIIKVYKNNAEKMINTEVFYERYEQTYWYKMFVVLTKTICRNVYRLSYIVISTFK